MSTATTQWHGQLRQDQWVVEHLGESFCGLFIDVGAHDGVEHSNTLALESYFGWRGICVEPNATTFERLKNNRTAECIHRAVWDVSGCTLRIQDAANPMNTQCTEDNEGEPILTIGINDLFQKLGGVIGYLSLDTEGTEQKILEAIDMENCFARCITMEHNQRPETVGAMINWCNANGYLHRIFHWDIFAIADRAVWV